MRSAFARIATSRVPSEPAKAKVPSSGCSSSRSTTSPALFDLEGKCTLRQAGRGGGPEEVRPLERPVGFGQAIQPGFDDTLEQHYRVRDVFNCDGLVAGTLPLLEELFEDLVDEMPAFTGRETRFLFPLLRQAQHLRCVVFERTLEIPLDVADCVSPGAASSRGSVVASVG